jgi:hypothetical protein
LGSVATVAFALSILSTSPASADYAYIGYYHSNQVTQLSIGSGGNTTVTSGTTIASGYAPEMITSLVNMPGANPNQIFVVNTSAGTVESYATYSGGGVINPNTPLSTNIMLNAAGTGAITLGSMAGATLSSNGQDYYVASSAAGGTGGTGPNGTNASGIYEFSTTTGREVGFTAFTDAHDVTFHNGMVYATAYQASGTSGITGNAGVWVFNANLTSGSQLIAPTGTAGNAPTGATGNDLYNATGMTFVGNNLYVGNASINGGSSGQSFVQEYSLTYGALASQTSATMVNTYMSASGTNNIDNPFGLTTGPDGNVYISSLGNIPSGGSDPGQITELNATTGAQSVWLSYGNDDAGQAPKYLSFASESVVYVPEPGSMVLMGFGLAGVALIGRRRKRKAAVAV